MDKTGAPVGDRLQTFCVTKISLLYPTPVAMKNQVTENSRRSLVTQYKADIPNSRGNMNVLIYGLQYQPQSIPSTTYLKEALCCAAGSCS